VGASGGVVPRVRRGDMRLIEPCGERVGEHGKRLEDETQGLPLSQWSDAAAALRRRVVPVVSANLERGESSPNRGM